MQKTGLIALLLLCLTAPLIAKDKEPFQEPSAVKLDRKGEKWAEKTLKKMTIEQKVGQMIMPWALAEFMNVNSPEYLRLRDQIRKYHLGGFGVSVHVWNGLLMKSEPLEAAAMMNQLQRDSEIPLIFAADFERGLSMRLNGATTFPHAMAYGAAGDLRFAEEFGRITAQESRAIGIVWNWFPTADANSNPVNPIINTRAFGEDPKQVGDLVAAYIKGAHSAGMLTTAKHFPGHGDTATDSHLGLATVNGDLNRLQTVELPPFQAAINAGVDSVMVAHVTVPALDPTPNRVATNSPAIVTDLLKGKMGFKGLVVTDALDMNGLMRIYANGTSSPSALAAVATVKAGNDMVLIPGDLDAAYNGILNAVKSGELTEKRIDESVLKILKAKASVGLHKAKLVDLNQVNVRVADPNSKASAQAAADAAVTLLREDAKVLPIKPSQPQGTNKNDSPYAKLVDARGRVVLALFTDDIRSEGGRVFERQLRARVPDATVFWIDANNADVRAESLLAAVDKAESVVAAIYAVPTAGKAIRAGNQIINTVGMDQGPGSLLNKILERAADKTAVVAMGNPYVAGDFPKAKVFLCTFSNAAVSENSAVKALFGEMPIHGRLPVSIPQVAQRGAGLERPQVAGVENDQNKKAAGR